MQLLTTALRVALIISGLACVATTAYLLAATNDSLQRGRAWSAAVVCIGLVAGATQRIAQNDGHLTVGLPITFLGVTGWTISSIIAVRRINKRGSSG